MGARHLRSTRPCAPEPAPATAVLLREEVLEEAGHAQWVFVMPKMLLSWRHTGFSVHNRVRVEPEDHPAVERLARYIMRPPISLESPVPGQSSEFGGTYRFERPIDAGELAPGLENTPQRRVSLESYERNFLFLSHRN